ncbi:MAG: hypothetical protein Q7S59_04480, partial [Sulfurimonas sp.]|nr:hypothetical protein [Sulfurimonas sp.]
MNDLAMIATGIYNKAGGELAHILPVLPYAAAGVVGLYGYSIFPRYKQIDGFIFEKYADSSFSNPANVKAGYRWATTDKLNTFTRKRKEVYIDNFRFDEEFTQKVKMPGFHKKSKEKTKVFFNAQDLVEGMLIIGKMKSGKSELYNSILSQPF